MKFDVADKKVMFLALTIDVSGNESSSVWQ
jgi:hypothetical protein